VPFSLVGCLKEHYSTKKRKYKEKEKIKTIKQSFFRFMGRTTPKNYKVKEIES